jgi:hypothetical protein
MTQATSNTEHSSLAGAEPAQHDHDNVTGIQAAVPHSQPNPQKCSREMIVVNNTSQPDWEKRDLWIITLNLPPPFQEFTRKSSVILIAWPGISHLLCIGIA